MWIKVDKNEIAKLNELSTKHKIGAVETLEGFFVVSDDLLTEPLFGHAFEYLNSCEKIELEKSEFIKPEMPIYEKP